MLSPILLTGAKKRTFHHRTVEWGSVTQPLPDRYYTTGCVAMDGLDCLVLLNFQCTGITTGGAGEVGAAAAAATYAYAPNLSRYQPLYGATSAVLSRSQP
eukprot:COSAG02_NODE_12930_length_1470_cov_12.994894_1_plen_100_part_00